MPKYQCRAQFVEATPVDLAGQRLVAVSIDGKAHLVDAGVFDTLFQPEPQKLAGLKSTTVAAAETIQPKRKLKPKATAAGSRISDVAQRCIDILQQHGPLTSAELRDHVYRDLKDPRKRLQDFSALSLDMRRRSLIERRTDPATQLDKWHLFGEVAHAGN